MSIWSRNADSDLVVLEGLHALKHALRFGAEILDAVAADPGAALALAGDLAPDLTGRLQALLRPVDPAAFRGLAGRPVATGVLALARPVADAETVLLEADGPAILLEDPRHLGNVGAVVRVAAAAGAAGVLTTGPADPWHPAALRGSAGLHFALPVLRIDALPDTSRPLIALHPDGEPLRPDLLPPAAILAFGSERRGLSRDLLDRAHARMAIPMRPGVSSLNLATAVAVVLYAARLAR
ncbi:MAG TPA: TrmH family RNA methyltransferase [Geminicoccaceae bacterium]